MQRLASERLRLVKPLRQTYIRLRYFVMIDAIRHLFRSNQARHLPTIPAGERVYAIGDIHGRNDLFSAICTAIEGDDLQRGPADTTVVLLGDLIDRGPESAGVIESARIWQKTRKVRILGGNHEEMFLQSFDRIDALRHFLRFGGGETLLSYPIDPAAYQAADFEELQELMRQAVSQADLDFISGFEDHIEIGDYLFVHAGIRPGEDLLNQRTEDLRWIREPFLSHAGDHGYVVVHGHSITYDVEIRPNRIGIDTGAYMSGKLSALGLEGTRRWLIEAEDGDGVVTTSLKTA